MMQSSVLQPVPGTRRTEIFPYIRKIDLMSSNSYLLSGRDQIALIDPGALDDQWDLLSERMIDLHEQLPRPVVIYLTHTHLDHCLQLKRCRENRKLGRIVLAVQELGAEALEKQDAKMTLAGLLGRDLCQISADVRLLSRQDTAAGGERQLPLGDMLFSYATRSNQIPSGPELTSQLVSLGGDDLLEIYPIPGHSPDSICIRAGGLLFVGDLFFAPNPGTAGAYGWSQKDLLASIQKVLWIMEQKNIVLCCPGHGRAIDAELARSSLQSMYHDVLSLSGLEEINPLWARNTAAYAEDLMRVLERLFVIMTGRLAYISQVLDWLEEPRDADRLQSLIDVNEIDRLFAEFNSFALELQAGRRLNWELVHKAGQLVGKLDRILEKGDLGSVLDLSLLKRAKRMLNDYTVTYRGFRPTYYVTELDVNMLLPEVLQLIEFKPCREDAIIEAEDHESYLRLLRSRIAQITPFENVTIQFIENQGLPPVRMDKERFVEAFADLLERLCCAGATGMRIRPSMEEGLVAIRIAVAGDVPNHSFDERALRFFERAFALCGGFIQIDATAERPAVLIEFLSRAMF